MLHGLIISSLVGYIASAILFTAALSKRGGSNNKAQWGKTGSIARAAFILSWVLHSGSIVALLLVDKGLTLSSYGDFYFWLAWVLAAFFLFGGKNFQYAVVGAFISASVGVFIVSSSLLVHDGAPQSAIQLPILLSLHVIPALLSEALMIFAGVLSGIYLVNSRKLKKKGPHLLETTGPSLDSLAMRAHRFVLLGFLAMTLAVVTGILWAVTEHRALLGTDPVQWTAFLSWMLLGGILQARAHLGWSTRRVAKLTVIVVGVYFISCALIVFFSGNLFHAVY